MSYEKQAWVSGDIITADKLNHIEDGITNIPQVLNISITTPENDGELPYLNKTWAEINNAINAGAVINDIYVYENATNAYGNTLISKIYNDIDNGYMVELYVISMDNIMSFHADSENDPLIYYRPELPFEEGKN